MQILHIIQCTNLGGMEHAALSITKGLEGRGHQCRWVSLNPLGGLKPLLDRAKVPCLGLQYRGPWGVLSVPAMRRAFRVEPRDAVIMTGTNYAAMLALGRRTTEPRILCVHYPHEGVKPRWQWRAIYALALRRFRAVTFVSDFIRREAEDIYPPIAAISRTIRTPAEMPPLPSCGDRLAARARLGIPCHAPVIGNAGWLIPRKRFDVFLRVAARLAACLPDAVFVIAGDGSERASLECLAQQLDIAQKVKWMGWQTDLTDFYLSLDVMLFNTDGDAFPNAPLDAMGYGIPVVASAIQGGLGEVISSEAYGCLLERHDVPALAEEVQRCLAAPGSVGMAGRKRVQEIRSPDICISQIMQELTPRAIPQ